MAIGGILFPVKLQDVYGQGGAGGVGRAATLAVVGAAVLILASNYILTSIFVRVGI